MSEITFVQRLINKTGGEIRFLTARENGAECWFYLQLSPEQFADYEKNLRVGSMNIRDYGEILESGWGEYPPEDMVIYMQQTYGVITPELP